MTRVTVFFLFLKQCLVENIQEKFQRDSSATFISEESPEHTRILMVALLRNTVFAKNFKGVVIIIRMLET